MMKESIDRCKAGFEGWEGGEGVGGGATHFPSPPHGRHRRRCCWGCLSGATDKEGGVARFTFL